MKPLYLLLGAALVALWAGDRALATVCLLFSGLWATYLQHAQQRFLEQVRQWAEEQSSDDRASYPQLILTAMGWAASGKTATSRPARIRAVHTSCTWGIRSPTGWAKAKPFSRRLKSPSRTSSRFRRWEQQQAERREPVEVPDHEWD